MESKCKSVTADRQSGKLRDSNFELYRIIAMLAVIAHHYVVNSGLMDCITNDNAMAPNSLFLLLLGCWGKVAINCFVLITGYFMCKANITIRKFLKLILECCFYKYVIILIFAISGYQELSLQDFVISLIPFQNLTDDFMPCYLVFFLFIPFLNILLRNITERQHRNLLLFSIGIFSAWASVPLINLRLTYVIWFIVLYFSSSYIRLYSIPLFNNRRFWGWMSVFSIVCSFGSVVTMVWLKRKSSYINENFGYYFFLADSNKLLALVASVCFFMYFKNLKIKYNRWINQIAASSLGVLCIHASSDTMRQWLWKDICRNVEYYSSPYLIVHAFGTVLAVFIVCTVLDQLRIHFIESPVFAFYDRKIEKE